MLQWSAWGCKNLLIGGRWLLKANLVVVADVWCDNQFQCKALTKLNKITSNEIIMQDNVEEQVKDLKN